MINGYKSLVPKLIAALSIHYDIIESLLAFIIFNLVLMELLAVSGLVGFDTNFRVHMIFAIFLMIIMYNMRFSFSFLRRAKKLQKNRRWLYLQEFPL